MSTARTAPALLVIHPEILACLHGLEGMMEAALVLTKPGGDLYRTNPAKAAEANRTGRRFINAVRVLRLGEPPPAGGHAR